MEGNRNKGNCKHAESWGLHCADGLTFFFYLYDECSGSISSKHGLKHYQFFLQNPLLTCPLVSKPTAQLRPDPLQGGAAAIRSLIVPDAVWPLGPQHARLPRPSPSPGICSNSCPLSQWCHPTTSSSVVPFSSCLQSFPASGSFLSNQSPGFHVIIILSLLKCKSLATWWFGVRAWERHPTEVTPNLVYK